MAYCLQTTKNFRKILNKLSKNSFNSPVIRTNKCLAKQDKVNCLPSVVWPLSTPEINLLCSTDKSRTNVCKPPREQKRGGEKLNTFKWMHTYIYKRGEEYRVNTSFCWLFGESFKLEINAKSKNYPWGLHVAQWNTLLWLIIKMLFAELEGSDRLTNDRIMDGEDEFLNLVP